MIVTDEPGSTLPGWEAFQRQCYRIAEEHGFHDKDADFDDVEKLGLQYQQRILLVISELVEAHDEHRKGADVTTVTWARDGSPHGVPIELADAIIRIADLAATYHVDLEAAIVTKMIYNESRPYLHNKRF